MEYVSVSPQLSNFIKSFKSSGSSSPKNISKMIPATEAAALKKAVTIVKTTTNSLWY